MFFCEDCRQEKHWPFSISKSHGPCELCGKVCKCNDVPSKFLVEVEEKKKRHNEVTASQMRFRII